MMEKSLNFIKARELAVDAVRPIDAEKVSLSNCGGRILACDIRALENVPNFECSPYDGYALRAADTASASKENPVTLQIIEEVPAGAFPRKTITEGAASKVLTGAPIPPGADVVIMYEKTVFTDEYVTVFSPLKSGDDIVRAGEDAQKGDLLARCGECIDPGLIGSMAAQGISEVMVYRVPKVAVISTGSELVEADAIPHGGKIRNSSRYMLECALSSMGFEPVYMGIVSDSVAEIYELIKKGLAECDAVVTTGGVSASDFDLTPKAIEKTGAKTLFRSVDLKPGMACAYGVYNGKLICGLSGNPASALTNFYAVAVPALKKIAGCSAPMPEEIDVKLLHSFDKKSPKTRLLRGKLVFCCGAACISLPIQQGNVVLSSTIGCNVMAIVPAGSVQLSAGTILKGFLL